MMSMSERVGPEIDDANVHFVDVEGARTRYYEAGEGPPILFLSGGEFGTLYSLDCWGLNLAPMASAFHVYAVDKLGQGHSDNPKSDDDYTFEAVLQHITAFVNLMGLGSMHVVGHSRGGLLGCWLAHRHPDIVRSLTIVDSGSTAEHDPSTPPGGIYESLGFTAGWDPNLTPTTQTVGIEPRGQAFFQEQVTDEFLARLLEIARLPKTREAQVRMQVLSQRVRRTTLTYWREENLRIVREEGLPVPTLVVWGMNDRTASVDSGMSLFRIVCERTSNCEFHVLNRAGHYSFRDQAAGFNRVLRSFVEGQERLDG